MAHEADEAARGDDAAEAQEAEEAEDMGRPAPREQRGDHQHDEK